MVTTMVPPRRRARRLAALLAATAAALPRTCEVSIGEDYLLGEPAALKCGLPVSRSYLLSKYGLALVAEAPASPEAGRPLTITVKGCDVKESVDAYPWFDSYTTNGTRDLRWCDPSALEIWVRAYGPSIEVADVVPSAETCAWTATFRRGLLPGAYAVDVLNTWLRGDEEPKTPHYDAVKVQRGRGWRGEQFDWQNAAGGDLKRGSPFMLCGDRCMLYDECAFWTQRKPGKPPQCTFYKSVKGTDKNEGGESGSRKDERVPAGVGGRRRGAGTPTAPCASGAAPRRWVRGPCDGECERLKGLEKRRDRTKKSDADWDFEYAWRPHDCAYEQYAPDDVKACLERRGVDVVFLSGDSVIQGCTPAFYEKLGGAPNAPPDKVAADAGVKVMSLSMTMSNDGKALKNLLRVLSAHVGDGKLGVVLSNFGVQHVQWSKTVADAKRTLKPSRGPPSTASTATSRRSGRIWSSSAVSRSTASGSPT
ncbi:hypothetical protein JL721_2692 [Aureococcus anophagefferens]|nr:hypothetical protein JL721_2692 [Aureococcus anophagefferens]